VRVFDKAGTALGTITLDERPANCTFGGADRRTLYITARAGLYAIVLNVPGLP
jgi:gluconolactonase